MAVQKTVSEWEVERGVIVKGMVEERLEKSMTESSFDKLCEDFGVTRVFHADRVAFLEKNGYEVTRENMVDSSLSAQVV